MNKTLSYLSLAVQVLILVLVASFVFRSPVFGGATNYDQLDTTDGYSVDGTSIVNGSGVFTGAITSANAVTLTGDTRIQTLVGTGSQVALAGTTSSVITAAAVCDAGYATTTPSITEASTLTTPTAALLFADCLTTDGDSSDLIVLNTTASTTVVTAGASSTIAFDGSTGGSVTLAANSWAFLKFVRTSATAYVTIMSQYKF